MTDLFKIKLSDIFANCQFWFATLVVYFEWRHIPTEQVFFLLSFYSICAFVFEYPTGVIADYFSPKISLIIGYLLSAICMFLQTFQGNVYYYGFLLAVSSIAFTLTSGSDTALLHNVSKDFKNDYAQVKMWGLIMTSIAAAVGGIVGAYDLRFPLYLTSLFFLISTVLLFLTRGSYGYEQREGEGNIFATAKEGVQHVFNNGKLLYLFIPSTFVGIFIISFKFFFNPFFEEIHLPLPWWGIFISISVLFSALGIRLYKSFSHIELLFTFLLFVGVLSLLGIVWIPAIAIGGFWLTYLFRGYIETQLDVLINETITSRARASVLSFKSVLVRIGQSLYTLVGGLIIADHSFFPLIVLTVLILLVTSLYPLIKIRLVYGTK